jgi:dienelactone hydrolase
MPFGFRFRWIVAVFLLVAVGAAAHADELVQIASHRAAGRLEAPTGTPALFGYLTRPDLPGRLPAVVVLHWCSGFGRHDVRAALTLKSWGYVALAPDSLGAANMCLRGSGDLAEATDAYAALHWLIAQDFVDRDRVAVIGYSMGAIAVLDAIERGILERTQPEHFRAAVAYYPACAGSSGNLTTAALILIGGRDDWTPAEACRKMVAHNSDIGVTRSPGEGVAAKLVVYPDATHAFDSPGDARRYLGHFIEYDPDATKDAETQVRAFLHDAMAATAH